MSPIYTSFRLLRVYQWSKNLLVWAPLLFAHKALEPVQALHAAIAFAAFCMASSATYIFNDLLDVEQDRTHPKKRLRPIASGAVSVRVAGVCCVFLALAALGIAGLVHPKLFAYIAAYMTLTLLYTLWLKHIVIVDVMAVALGFVLRAMAGAVAIDVAFSNWLVVCTLFLAMFLGLGKRRHEILTLDDAGKTHRKVLLHYTVEFLDQLILIVAGGALITYTIYTCSPEVVSRLHTDKLYLTLPFVVYGLFRYLFLVHHQADGGDPSSTLFGDKPIAITVLLWAVSCALIIYC